MSLAGHVGPRVVMALLVVYLVWGTTFYAIRVSLLEYPPFFLSGVRFLLAGGLLFAYAFAVGALHVTRRLLLDALVTGVLLVTLGNGLVVVAEQHVSSGIAALVISTESVFILVLAFLYGRRLSAVQFIGIALCFVGVAILSLGTELRYSPAALVALLVAALAWALGSTWGAQRAQDGNTLTLVAMQMLIGGSLSLLLAWLSDERFVLSDTPSANLALLYLALFGSIATFVSYDYLLRRVSPSLSSSYAYVNPAIAFAVGCVFDDDAFHLSTALSLFGVLAGVWLIVQHEAKAA